MNSHKKHKLKKGRDSVLKTIINDHRQNARQILALSRTDLTRTYRGAVLGWSWAIIRPSVTLFAWWFAIAIGLRAGSAVSGDFPYILWLIAGMVPWFYISGVLMQVTNSIRKYSYLITKMKFPVSTIPTFCNLAQFYVFLIMMAAAVIIFMLCGHMPDIYYLQMPLYILMTFLFCAAWGLFACPLAAISKDFFQLVKSVNMLLFWLSGIIWNPATIDIAWLRTVMLFNPICYLVNGMRNCMVNKIWFFEEPVALIGFLIELLILTGLGLLIYSKTARDLPDIL